MGQIGKRERETVREVPEPREEPFPGPECPRETAYGPAVGSDRASVRGGGG
jgi:hypothetical protein